MTLHRDRTHELRIYASSRHKTQRHGVLITHLWFIGETTMQIDLDIALARDNVAYVDVIDCINHTTERQYKKEK